MEEILKTLLPEFDLASGHRRMLEAKIDSLERKVEPIMAANDDIIAALAKLQSDVTSLVAAQKSASEAAAAQKATDDAATEANVATINSIDAQVVAVLPPATS